MKTNPTTALDAFLASLASPEQQPDEFTAREAHAALQQRGDKSTLNAVRMRLIQGVESGIYDARSTTIGGKQTNLYRLRTPGTPPTPTLRPSASSPSTTTTQATVRRGKGTKTS